MQRHDVFQQVHQGLRRSLYETNTLICNTGLEPGEGPRSIFSHLRHTLHLMEQQHRVEEQLILPLVAEYEPSVSDCFANEHLEGKRRAAVLADLVHSSGVVATEEKADALRKAYRGLLTFYMTHLDREAIALNTILWRYFDDTTLSRLSDRCIHKLHERQELEQGLAV